MSSERSTKYTRAVQEYLSAKGHASNAEITEHIRLQFPEVSATTIHRITARMIERSEAGTGPVTAENTLRLDANTTPHDHFQCLTCDCVRDIQLSPDILSLLQAQLGDCRFSGNLTIQGTCANCLKEEL
jgi:Fe2+ or Zn2+ uptake regulation protein